MKIEIKKQIALFLIGAICYGIVEVLWRGYTHVSMLIVGGAMFLLVGGINEYLPWSAPLELQCVIGSSIITITEFVVGVILNIYLGLNIWDYSNMPYNVMGQICPIFSLAWCALSLVAILLDDYLRYKLWGEDFLQYTFIISRLK